MKKNKDYSSLNKSSQRIELLDILKGIAILLVIVGHCIQCGSGTNYMNNLYFFDNIIFKFIYSFHMPLFMLISGFLFFYSINNHTTKDILKSRVKNLIIPIISFTIIKFIIDLLFYHVNFNTLVTSFLDNLWFLWAVFYCSLVVLLVNKLFKDNLLVYLLIFVLLFFIPDKFNIQMYSYMYIYFLLGYYFNKYNLKQKLKKHMIPIFFVNTLLFFGMLYLFRPSFYIYLSGYYVLKGNVLKQIIINLFRMFIGIFGSVSLISFIKIITSKFDLNFKILKFLGKNSLEIYILSSYIFSYIFPIFNKFILDINYFIIFLETLGVTLIYFCLSIIIKKSKLLSTLLFGSR